MPPTIKFYAWWNVWPGDIDRLLGVALAAFDGTHVQSTHSISIAESRFSDRIDHVSIICNSKAGTTITTTRRPPSGGDIAMVDLYFRERIPPDAQVLPVLLTHLPLPCLVSLTIESVSDEMPAERWAQCLAPLGGLEELNVLHQSAEQTCELLAALSATEGSLTLVRALHTLAFVGLEIRATATVAAFQRCLASRLARGVKLELLVFLECDGDEVDTSIFQPLVGRFEVDMRDNAENEDAGDLEAEDAEHEDAENEDAENKEAGDNEAEDEEVEAEDQDKEAEHEEAGGEEAEDLESA